MATVVGIDEAGYGPRLGPLVVSAAAFEVRGGVDASADLWDALDGAVARTRRGGGGRLLVADSKAVYRAGTGLADLERGVLAALSAGGRPAPASFRMLLGELCPDAPDLCEAPWWSDLSLPVAAETDAVASGARLLGDASCGARPTGIASRVVRAVRFNESLRRCRNKSVLLFQETMALVERALARYDGDVTFVIDKHGGRHYYHPLLANHFFGRPVHPLHESPRTSTYEVASDRRTARLAFVEKADVAHLPVALASMASKYVRELFMKCFNTYWCGRVDGLAPTAGYAADSARFIATIRPALADGEERDLIRLR
jgi:hypothetical protein